MHHVLALTEVGVLVGASVGCAVGNWKSSCTKNEFSETNNIDDVTASSRLTAVGFLVGALVGATVGA
jgi:hypothetical protein